jgi:nucleoside phosphorylase
MGAYPIEILSIGGDHYAHILSAIYKLNAAQLEFKFEIPPTHLKDKLISFAQSHYQSDEIYERLTRYQKEAKGFRPFLIAVIDQPLRSKTMANLFGTHQASRGFAVVTLKDHERFAGSATQYLCYYFVRYALSFVAPELRSHDTTLGCMFDFKRNKDDLRKSLATGHICDDCMKKLSESLNPTVYVAIVALREVLKSFPQVAPKSLSARVLNEPAESEGDTKEPKAPSHGTDEPIDIKVEYEAESQAWFKRPLPELEDVNSHTLDRLRAQIDVVILVATPVERDAVLRLVEPPKKRKRVLQGFQGARTYFVGRYGSHSVAVTMSAMMGAVRRDASLIAAHEAITFWDPRALLMVGIAFGRGRKQRMADVLVSEKIIQYEPERMGAERIPRGDSPNAGTVLLDRFKNVLGWTFKRPDDTQCAILMGALLSGEKLVDNPAFKEQLFKTFPEAIGGDMEGAGVASAAERLKKEWILVKGICDWGDGKKHGKHQPLAAAAAADLVRHVLSRENVLHGIRRDKIS